MNFRYQRSTIILILSCFFSITIKAQRLSHKLDIRITQPSYLSGSYEYGSPVDFGPTAIPVTSGDLVWAYDVNGDSTVCNTITTDLTNKIALIRRGGCSFVDKIYGAQQRGAIAVVIINNTDDDLTMDMTSSTNGHLVNIPAVFVSGNTGNKWASTLDSGKTVKLEFYPPSVEYCQFNHYSKVPLKYAPDIDNAFVQIYNHTKTEQKNVKVNLRFIDPKNNITTWDTIISSIAPLSKGYGNYENMNVPFSTTKYGWYTVEATSSIAKDTIRHRFEATLNEYALDLDDTSIAVGLGISDNTFAAANNDGYTYRYEVGSQFRIPTYTSQDSIMISFALENPADFFGETFYLNLRNSTQIDRREQSFFNKNFYLFGIGSYTITAEDTLHPHKLLTAKIINISNLKDITELKDMTEVIASVEYIGDGRIKKSPKFSHTRNSDYYLDYVSGIAVSDKLYLNGFGLPKPIIRMRLIDCYQDFDTAIISACDSFNFHGKTYFESGIYTQKYTNVDGCDSLSTLKLSISKIPRDTIYETACGQFTWNDSVYKKSGIYHQIFKNPNLNSCDSVATLFLTINALPDTSISVTNNVLTTKAQNATLQWLNCNNNFMPIEGEIFSFFAPETEGDYALELETTEGCKDTSACYTIQFNHSIKPFKTEGLNVYPNPNNGRFELKGLDEIQISNFPFVLLVFNSQGERVLSHQIEHDNSPIQTTLSSGVYIIQIVTPNTIYTQRMVVSGR